MLYLSLVFNYKDVFFSQISGNPHIKLVPEMDGDLIEGIENKTMTVFHHPGQVSRKLAEFDDKMIYAIRKILNGSPSNTTSSDFHFLLVAHTVNYFMCNFQYPYSF